MFIVILSLVFSALGDNPQSLLKPYPANPLINEVIVFEPVADHKFNLKGKQNCGNGWMINETEAAVECQMSAPGTSDLEMYVCDQKNTYCRREEFKLKTQQPQGFFAWLGYYKNNLFAPKKWSSPNRTDVSHVSVARGFRHNDLKDAIWEAGRYKKNLLVYFTQLSCEPCRLLKELTFASDEFQEITKDYIRVQVDFDIDVEPAKVKPLKIMGTPTVILFNKDFKELARSSHMLSPQGYAAWLKAAPEKPVEKIAEEQTTDKAVPPQDLNLAGRNCGDSEMMDRAYDQVEALLTAKAGSAEYTKAQKIFDGIFAHVKTIPGGDALQCAYSSYNLYSVQSYVFKKQGRWNDVKKVDGQLIKLANSFPKLPGVTETPQLEIIKAEATSDEARQKAYAAEKEKHAADYSYDFFEASDARIKKKYDAALASIDKSLAVAKDRSWQKAFLYKLDILADMKRKDDALKLIDEVLGQIQLPAEPSMKVHTFVQNLRKKQTSLQKQEISQQ